MYSCYYAKHRGSDDWSAANSNTSSCVIAKNSAPIVICLYALGLSTDARLRAVFPSGDFQG